MIEKKKISEEWLIKAANHVKEPYDCGICSRVHKHGTKIWDEHISESGSNKNILSEARFFRGKYLRELKEKMEKQLKEGLSTFPRYDLYDVTGSYPFRHMGREGGYNTIQELMKDNDHLIEKARKGKHIAVIAKIEIYKIIK